MLFDNNPVTKEAIEEEAKNVFNSRKVREVLYHQAAEKVRWRMNAEGKMSSNTKLVKWSDGTFGIYIGNQYYEIDGVVPGNQMVFTADESLMVSVAGTDYSGYIKKKSLV